MNDVPRIFVLPYDRLIFACKVFLLAVPYEPLPPETIPSFLISCAPTLVYIHSMLFDMFRGLVSALSMYMCRAGWQIIKT